MNSLTLATLPDDVVTTILRNADLQTCGRLACTDRRTAVLWGDGVPGRWDPRCAHCHGRRVSTANIVLGKECRFSSITEKRVIRDDDTIRLNIRHGALSGTDDHVTGCLVQPTCMEHVERCIDCGKIMLLEVWKSNDPHIVWEATVSCTVCWDLVDKCAECQYLDWLRSRPSNKRKLAVSASLETPPN